MKTQLCLPRFSILSFRSSLIINKSGILSTPKKIEALDFLGTKPVNLNPRSRVQYIHKTCHTISWKQQNNICLQMEVIFDLKEKSRRSYHKKNQEYIFKY